MKKITLYTRKAHRILMTIVGLQLLIWSLSGLYMTLVPLELIHGDHLRQSISPQTAVPKNINLPTQSSTFSELTLHWWLDRWVFTAKAEQATYLIDAQNQQTIIVTEAHIKQLAQATIAQPYSIRTIKKLDQYPSEIGGKHKAVWQVTFAYWNNPILYFDVDTGQVIRARSDLWRLFDFFWGLHIMDYNHRENINNVLLTLASSLTLIAVIAGLSLLFIQRKWYWGRSWQSRLLFLHKTFALLVGVQFLLWALSGFIFNQLDPKLKSGKHLLATQANTLQITSAQWQKLLTQLSSEVTQITLFPSPVGSFASMTTQAHTHTLSVATQTLPQLPQQQIIALTQQRFVGETSILNAELLVEPTAASRKVSHPIWAIQFSDAEQSQVFVNPYTANIEGIHTQTKAIFDWFWMLHIMDYEQQDDFNHPLVILMASIACFMSLSGLIIVLRRYFKKQRLG